MTEADFRWQSFLDRLAGKAELAKQEAVAFKYQFDRQQEHQSTKSIEESFDKKNHYENGTYNSTIKRVYNKLNNLGIDLLDKPAADKSDVVWQWLKQNYPQWEEQLLGRSKLSIDALWSQLKELGQHAPDRMGIYIAENKIETMGVFPEGYQPQPYLSEIPQGTQRLKFKIVSENSENMEQVLLLTRDESKVVYCLCPSEFAPSIDLNKSEKVLPQSEFAPIINLNKSEKVLPQSESKYAYLGAETRGREEWWGWIVSEMPPLSWLDTARDTALELKSAQLAELLSRVESQQGEVLYTSYLVI
jgi:hypothetical protein